MRTKSTNNTFIALVFLLILVVLGLVYYTYNLHSSVSAREAQLESEKVLVSLQLQDEIKKYSTLLNDRDTLKQELAGAQDRLKALEKSLSENNISSTSVRRLQLEVRKLRQEREFFINRTDSLSQETQRLSALQQRTQKALDKATKSQDSIQNSNTVLKQKLKEGARITGSSLIARGVIQRNSGKFVHTLRANRTEMLQVCYSINENTLAQPTDEVFYVQIRKGNGAMIGIERRVTWSDGTITSYNASTTVPYQGKAYSVCDLVLPLEKLDAGTYTVIVYNKKDVFLSTTFDLK